MAYQVRVVGYHEDVEASGAVAVVVVEQVDVVGRDVERVARPASHCPGVARGVSPAALCHVIHASTAIRNVSVVVGRIGVVIVHRRVGEEQVAFLVLDFDGVVPEVAVVVSGEVYVELDARVISEQAVEVLDAVLEAGGRYHVPVGVQVGDHVDSDDLGIFAGVNHSVGESGSRGAIWDVVLADHP